MLVTIYWRMAVPNHSMFVSDMSSRCMFEICRGELFKVFHGL